MAQSNQGGERHQADNSTIISLGELMQMEQLRIDEEKQRKERQRREHEAALRKAREKREQQLEDQRRAAEQSRRAHERAEMEEAAELAGKILGFISRAKVQAEYEVHALAMQQEHQRAVELAQARNDSRLGVLRWTLLAVAFASVSLLCGMLGAYAGWVAPDHQRALAALHADLSSHVERSASLERTLATERDEKRGIEQRREALENQLSKEIQRTKELKDALARNPCARPTIHGPKVTTPPPPSEPCLTGDPMCP
jgi:hypothetical protein